MTAAPCCWASALAGEPNVVDLLPRFQRASASASVSSPEQQQAEQQQRRSSTLANSGGFDEHSTLDLTHTAITRINQMAATLPRRTGRQGPWGVVLLLLVLLVAFQAAATSASARRHTHQVGHNGPTRSV